MAQSGKREASMVTLFFANVLYWVCAGVYSPFLSAHYTGLGLSAAETGILLAATPVCALAIQPLWSTIADKLGRRRAVIVVLCLGAAILAPLYYLAKTFVPVLLVTFAFSAFFSGLLPLSDSLVIELADRSGLDFSRIRMGGTIGYAIVVLIVGRLLDVAPQIQFAVVSAALVIFAAHMWRLPEAGVRANAEDAPKVSHGKGLLSLFTSNEIAFVLVFAFISSAAIGFIGTFLGR